MSYIKTTNKSRKLSDMAKLPYQYLHVSKEFVDVRHPETGQIVTVMKPGVTYYKPAGKNN